MKRLATCLAAALVIAAGASAGVAPTASNLGNPGVFPPQCRPYGKSYSEWSTAWWVYSITTPLATSPFGHGTDGTFGQSGPVWFLGGTFTGDNLSRELSVPEGKALFFPIFDAECSTIETPESGFHGDNEAELRACAMSWVDRGLSGEFGPVFCRVDGVEVKNLDKYRASTPLMDFILPASDASDNIFGMPMADGQEVKSVGDGVYVLLCPLPVGVHTIEFQNIHYTVRVVEPPHILPPQCYPYGKSYGQWSAAWWQWLFKWPVSENPLFLEGDVDLSLHQPDGPVWFLGGMLVGTPQEGLGYVMQTVRTGTVPAGKALLFPVLNCEYDNQTFVPPEDMTIPELFAYAHQSLDGNQAMVCEIDGVSIKNLWNPATGTSPYRAVSPVFSYWLPATDNVQQFWGVPAAGSIGPAVADGVFLMLAPPSVGPHKIHIGGGTPGVFLLDVTYNITVVPGGAR